jgi:prepilin-type N-terminal cleavage/methylation domain-containing protein/prepilin-type processing-associated H-X9-DG protein
VKVPASQVRLDSRRYTARDRRLGFTLLEMLFVVLIIAILAMLLLPVVNKAKARAKSVSCSSQLRQVGFAMHEFSHDHLDQFPFQVPTNQGGSLEFARAGFAMSGEFFFAFRHLQMLSNTLVTPRMLRCPTDSRLAAENFSALQNSNLSYFVATSAEYSQPESILCGDRNISGQSLASGSIVRVGTNSPVVWTAELHQFKGNLLFADSHVAQVNNAGLGAAVYASGTTVGYILPPVLSPPPGDEDNSTSIFLALKETLGPSMPSAASPASQDTAGGSSSSPDSVQPVPRTKGPQVADLESPGATPEPRALLLRESGRRDPTIPDFAAPASDPAATTNLAAKSGMKPLKRVTTGTPAAAPVRTPEVQSSLLLFAQHPEENLRTWLLLLLFVTVAAFLVGRQLHRRRQRRLGVA